MNELTLLQDEDTFNRVWRVAEVMSLGKSTVPTHLKGNAADCFAVCLQASQWGMNPFSVAQKTHLVSGTLGYEAQLVNSVVATLAPIKSRINYRWDGEWDKILGKFNGKAAGWKLQDEDGLSVTVWATMNGEDEPRELKLMLKQASIRNSPLWVSDPKQQLAYLAVKRWARLHCPDVMLGVYTPDELDQKPRNIGSGTTHKPTNSHLAPPVETAPPMDEANGIKFYANILEMSDTVAHLKNEFTLGWRWAQSIGSDKAQRELKSLYDACKATLEAAEEPAPLEVEAVEPADNAPVSDAEWLGELDKADE